MDALQQPTIRVAAIIAEGVPEKDTKKIIAFARANNKVIIGPATVGGVQVTNRLSRSPIYAAHGGTTGAMQCSFHPYC